jgi:predicted HicB family RNase H-like nuclease
MDQGNAYYSDMATDKAKLMVYLDPSYKEWLGKLAASQNRSMSNYVETLIIETVDKAVQAGELPPLETNAPPSE